MKISYITSHGVAEHYKFDPSDSSVIILSFTPQCKGALTIGASLYQVDHGEARLPTADLKDGEYHPRLECDTGSFRVRGFVKHGKGITPFPNDENTLKLLILECYELKKVQESYDKRIEHLEELCQGHNIFSFERKEQ